jgi:microcystin-dependent protein
MNIRYRFYKSLPLAFAVIALTLSTQVRAQTQGVGIDVPSPHPSAVLDLDDAANERGLLVPRMNSTERAAIASPADGLLVYDTDQKMFYHYDSGISQWQAVNPFSYRKGASAADEDNFVITFTNNKSLVVGTVGHTPAARLEVGGNVRATGTLQVDGAASTNTLTTAGTITSSGNITVNAPAQFVGNGTVPLGGIIMWSGTVPPTGWALCNGQTTAGGYRTPDLKGRFIVGYDPGPPANDYTQPGNLSRTTGSPAYVNGSTGGAAQVALSVAQMPAHSHGVTDPGHTHGHTDTYANNVDESTTSSGLSWNIYRQGTTDLARTTDLSTTGISLANSGSGSAHENRPPYYVLAFIMRVE